VIEDLQNLRHPLISAPIGFGFGLCESESELKIGRLYHAEGGSLAEVLLSQPPWWTPTAKARAVVGMALALRFAHSFGLLHGGLNSGNVLFDGKKRLQIVDFSGMRPGADTAGGFSGDGWTPRADISGFAKLLFEIVVGCPAGIPGFVSEMIDEGLCPRSDRELSFIAIIEALKKNDFQIVAGVEAAEVTSFVEWIESGEQSGEWK
jgi:hypothetical protein